MQVFRKIYAYNSQIAIYSSSNVKTYNCRNIQTNDTRLVLIKHLKQIPEVESNPNILQPIEAPNYKQAISVYPLVNCVSQISKIQQNQAIYILKCILQSPQKNPLYYIVTPSGICTSKVQGLLPQPSPKLFQLITQLLDVSPSSLSNPKTLLSKQCLIILNGLRDGENVQGSINLYGWKDKKQQIKDSQFWIFKGRKREQGIVGQEYGLAWKSKIGLVRFKALEAGKQNVERGNMIDFTEKIKFYMQNQDKKLQIIKVYKFLDQAKSIKLFLLNPNQGYLIDYVNKRKQLNKPITEEEFFPILQKFVDSMKKICQIIKGHSCLHIKYIYFHNNTLLLGQPMVISEKIEKKLRQLKNSLDYYAPQLKQNIVVRENLTKLDQQKLDIWSFGYILHKIFSFQLPIFDPSRKPILKKQRFSYGLSQLILSCLSMNPQQRPKWNDINFLNLKKQDLIINDIENQNYDESLGGSKKISKKQSNIKRNKTLKSQLIEQSSIKKVENEDSPLKKKKLNESEIGLKVQGLDVESEMIAQKPQISVDIMPQQLTGKLKKIKLIFKIICIMLLYLLVFFKSFLVNTCNILSSRGFLNPTTLYLVDNSGNILSQTTILSTYPQYFMLNDISFTDVEDTYHCINDQFDPIYNPGFSLNNYIQTNGFVGYIITGWLFLVLLCSIKSIMIWKGGIGNKNEKDNYRYWIVYIFSELCMATLLFGHFFIYQFLYFAQMNPCFSITALNGVQPFFDSILYLFLTNINGFLINIFTTIGIFSIVLILSLVIYTYSPGSDAKNFFTVSSILLRVIPYIAFVLISRIGIFNLYSPTAISDPLSMIPSLINYSVIIQVIFQFIGFIGIIPEIFIIICVLAELFLQLIFYYCEKKAEKSDMLNKLFNIHKRKITVDNSYENEHMELKNDSTLIANNKQQLELSELTQKDM